MAVRKSNDLGSESDSRYDNVKTAAARAKISVRFDDTTHNEQVSDEALQFLNKKVDEVIDVLNTNTGKTGISSAQASAISLNTAKNTNTDQDLSGLALKTAITGSFTAASSSFSSRVTLNDAKVTNADQSKSDINALDITEVGTISSGVWQGTTIKTTYIADANISMAKLANIATDTFIGRTASNAGVPKALSKTEALAILNVENGATADQSNTEILTAIEDGVDSVHYKDGSIDTDHIGDNQVTDDKLADSINTAISNNSAKIGTTSTERTRIAANHAKVSMVIGTGSSQAKAGNTTTISSGQASAISANTSKVGFVTTMPTATESVTCTLTVTKNRGVPNALVFTVIDSSGRTPVTVTGTVALEQ